MFIVSPFIGANFFYGSILFIFLIQANCTCSPLCQDIRAPVCSGSSCVPCSSDSDCASSPNTLCMTISGSLICVNCTSNSDCTNHLAPVCSLSNFACTDCSLDSDCTSKFPGTSCRNLPSSGAWICAKCTSNADCIGIGAPVCSLSSYTCIPCSSNSDCTSKFPGTSCRNLPSSGAWICAKCTSDADCTGIDAPVCSLSSYTCTACSSDSDCTSKFPGTSCSNSPSSGAWICAKCTSNAHCTGIDAPVCSLSSYTCIACSSNSDCTSKFPGTSCHNLPSSGAWICAKCTSNAHCIGIDAPVCSLSSYTCTACSSDSDCTPNFPGTQCMTSASGSKICAKCIVSNDCLDTTKPICNPADYTCVSCSSDQQCINRSPTIRKCDLGSGQCVPCLSNADCINPDKSLCINQTCDSCNLDSECSHIFSPSFCRKGLAGTTGGICGGCNITDTCIDPTAPRCALLPDSTSPTFSICSNCASDSDCTHIATKPYCRNNNGACGECLNNMHCLNRSASRCDFTLPSAVCFACANSSDCSHINGYNACVSGKCEECDSNNMCPWNIKPYCNAFYVCSLCIDDTHCSHLPTEKYCTSMSICKTVKAVFGAQSSTRIIPQKIVAFSLAVNFYPNTNADFSWNISERIPINSDQYMLKIPAFGGLNPLPLEVNISYTTKNAAGDDDTVSKILVVNHIPSGGTLSISPSSGIGLDKVFTLTTTMWTDNNGDTIFYKFYYSIDNGENYVPLQNFTTTPTLTTKLPPGVLENNYTVYIRISVTDEFRVENYAQQSVQVLLPNQMISDCLANLQSLASTDLSSALTLAVMTSDYLKQVEEEILDNVFNRCPTCSNHGSCFKDTCVCDSNYVLKGCSLSQTEYNTYIALKTKMLDILTNAYRISEEFAEQTFHTLSLITENLDLVDENIISRSSTLLNNILIGAESSGISLSLNALSDATETIQNCYGFTLKDCTKKSSTTQSIVNNLSPLLQYLSAIEVKMKNTTDPYIIEVDTFYVCIQQGVLASSLRNAKKILCENVVIQFPPSGINALDNIYVDLEFILPKPNFVDCSPSFTSISSYNLTIKESGKPSPLITTNETVQVSLLSGTTLICPKDYELVETSAGDLYCDKIDLSQKAVSDVKELISDSNWSKIMNYQALKDFDVLHSPLLYMICGFSLLMLVISIWAILKDKALDRDLFKLPKRAPSRLYRLMTYILISHSFFCIFVLFDSVRPRLMRSVLFYIKILGLMALSSIFSQTEEELGEIKKAALCVITIASTGPINFIIGYVVFSRQIQRKKRRKRLGVKGNKKAYSPEKAAQIKMFKTIFSKILSFLGYSLLLVLILLYIYIIFVITASNTQKNNQVVSKWLSSFVQSILLDFFGVQIGKVLVHLAIMSVLRNESKKKFLCIPRKYLPKMLNPVIFDFQKRFALLDQLYKPKPRKVELNPDNKRDQNLEPDLDIIKIEKEMSESTGGVLSHDSQQRKEILAKNRVKIFKTLNGEEIRGTKDEAIQDNIPGNEVAIDSQGNVSFRSNNKSIKNITPRRENRSIQESKSIIEESEGKSQRFLNETTSTKKNFS